MHKLLESVTSNFKKVNFGSILTKHGRPSIHPSIVLILYTIVTISFILSYFILSYPILYYPILHYPILYYPILYYPILFFNISHIT
jgi:ABC-type multidrug transport system permease subunit